MINKHKFIGPLSLCRDSSRFPLIGNIGMARRNAIAAGMKDERLTIDVFVLLYLTYKNNVVTAVVLANFSADKLGNDTGENR